MSRLQPLYLDVSGMDAQTLESYGRALCEQQRDVNWHLGDAVRKAKRLLGDNWSQCFPEWFSVAQLERCEAVSAAYPHKEDRNIAATWSIHRNHANKPNRKELVAASVDEGRTSDEDRKHSASRWLLAIDCNYFLHRFWFSGAGVEAASGVADWIERTVERLKAKGLTDVACCFDSKINKRKELTAEWDDKYKDRPPKDPELGHQLNIASEMLHEKGLPVVSKDGYEADDIMASFAKQFPGMVTLLTQDKDVRQCLSAKCNMLLDVEWHEDETSGEMTPDYKWLSAKDHTEQTGLRPDQWTEYQTLMGDACDGIKGAVGIGEKGAKDLVQWFGSVEGAIQAAKDGDERIKPKKIEALIAFESKAEITRKLVTLVDDLEVPKNTRLS